MRTLAIATLCAVVHGFVAEVDDVVLLQYKRASLTRRKSIDGVDDHNDPLDFEPSQVDSAEDLEVSEVTYQGPSVIVGLDDWDINIYGPDSGGLCNWSSVFGETNPTFVAESKDLFDDICSEYMFSEDVCDDMSDDMFSGLNESVYFSEQNDTVLCKTISAIILTNWDFSVPDEIAFFENKTAHMNWPVPVALLQSKFSWRRVGIIGSHRDYLGVQGADSCGNVRGYVHKEMYGRDNPESNDPFTTPNEQQCLKTAQRVIPRGATQGRRHLVAGSWSFVAPGCSVVPDPFDWAAHYNRLPGVSAHNNGNFQPVCTGILIVPAFVSVAQWHTVDRNHCAEAARKICLSVGFVQGRTHLIVGEWADKPPGCSLLSPDTKIFYDDGKIGSGDCAAHWNNIDSGLSNHNYKALATADRCDAFYSPSRCSESVSGEARRRRIMYGPYTRTPFSPGQRRRRTGSLSGTHYRGKYYGGRNR